MSRISYSIKNAKVAFVFNLAIILLGFISRRVWYDSLGADLIGISESVKDYIGFLNLADMGIAPAIAAVLYIPLFNDDRSKITELVSIYGFLFRWIGIVVGVAGVILSLFLPLLFRGEDIDLWPVYMAFYAFLTTTVISYVVNYKQNLLVANQKNYVVVTILNSATIIKIIIQIVLLKFFGFGFEMWLGLEIAAAVAFAIILEKRLRKEYPWLHCNLKAGREYLKKYPEIIRNIRQMFVHKISSFIVQQSQRIIIQQLIGVATVAFYGNYRMISDNLIKLTAGPLASNTGGVGNLIAESSRQKINMVFWQMNAMFFWIGGVVACGFFLFVTPLIKLWLPESETFSQGFVFLMAFNIFVYIVRQPVSYFVNAYGIFSDTYAAWIEAALNLSISITLGIKYGMIGIVAGTAISSLLIVMIWRPHYLYIKGFDKKNGMEYWITTLKYVLILAAVWIGIERLYSTIIPTEVDSWGSLFVNAAVITPIIALVYGGVLWLTSRGMRDFVKLSFGLITKRFS